MKYPSSAMSEIASESQEGVTDIEDLASPQINILAKPPPPTHYVSVAVTPVRATPQLPDPVSSAIFPKGVFLPPPTQPPLTFVQTKPTPLVSQVIQDLLHNQILVECPDIFYAFRLFLITKQSGAARTKQSGAARQILDMSPWTTFYDPPPIRLYSAPEVLAAISPSANLVKIYLKSGLFQIVIHPSQWHFYGVYY
jgi:hypothetical protein